MRQAIRVFPRRTKWTPTDDLAVVGEPGLFRPIENLPVLISVAFTWDIPEAERLYRSWSRFYENVQIGGPAFGDPGGDFVLGKFVKTGVVITSRGCTKQCDWCFAWRREGWIRELPIRSGSDVADNNILACSRRHIEKVFDMLRDQYEPIKFSGGLDAEFLQPWHVDLLKTVRLKYVWLACDYPGAITNLERAADLLGDFSIEKKRCYVLIGFNGESLKQAEKRCETVYHLGFLPMAMLYRGEQMHDTRAIEWMSLQKRWSRPAIYRTSYVHTEDWLNSQINPKTHVKKNNTQIRHQLGIN